MAKEEMTSGMTPDVTPEPAAEQMYSLAELKENAPLIFGVQSEVIAGALHGSTKQEFTVSELKELVAKFLGKKVK